MDYADALRLVLTGDPWRMGVLATLRQHGPVGAWVAAGFIRDAVWDHLHERPPAQPSGDVDVIWFDRYQTDPVVDSRWDMRLRGVAPEIDWSTKNQARMHRRNGDAPYDSVQAAMAAWPETATAVAVRLSPSGDIQVAAPFGLDDLFELRLKPSGRFRYEKYEIYQKRVHEKDWLHRYPRLGG